MKRRAATSKSPAPKAAKAAAKPKVAKAAAKPKAAAGKKKNSSSTDVCQLVPYLTIGGSKGAEALDFYAKAFGAVEKKYDLRMFLFFFSSDWFFFIFDAGAMSLMESYYTRKSSLVETLCLSRMSLLQVVHHTRLDFMFMSRRPTIGGSELWPLAARWRCPLLMRSGEIATGRSWTHTVTPGALLLQMYRDLM